jgi:hypothetical protein
MKMLVVYDEQGDIVSVNLPTDTMGTNLRLVPGEGQFVAEVDTSQVGYTSQIGTNQDDIPSLVESMVNNFRIQQGKLVPKG